MKTNFETWNAAKLTKEIEKISAERSRLTDLLIDAGRGNEFPQDTMKKEDKLSRDWTKAALYLMDLIGEKRKRMEYHGNLKPIK